MRIKTKQDLLVIICKALTLLSEDERYPESLESLKYAEKEIEKYDLKIIKKRLSDRLHDDDRIHPIHPEVAELLMNIYLDGIEEGDSDYMCKLGSLYYTGRAGEQDYKKAAEYYYMAEKVKNDRTIEKVENINGDNQEAETRSLKVNLQMNDFDRLRKDWDKIINEIKRDHNLLQVSFDTWLKPLKLHDLINNELLIIVPEEGYARILEKKYSLLIKTTIEIRYKIPIKIRYITESEAKELSI